LRPFQNRNLRWLEAIVALPDNSTTLMGTNYFEARYTVHGLTVTFEPVFVLKRGGE